MQQQLVRRSFEGRSGESIVSSSFYLKDGAAWAVDAGTTDHHALIIDFPCDCQALSNQGVFRNGNGGIKVHSW